MEGKGGVKMMVLGRMIPCQSREAVVTVVSYCNGIMDGYLQHPRLNGTEKLYSLSQMVLLMNNLLDQEDCLTRPLPFVSQIQTARKELQFFVFRFFFGNITHGRGS